MIDSEKKPKDLYKSSQRNTPEYNFDLHIEHTSKYEEFNPKEMGNKLNSILFDLVNSLESDIGNREIFEIEYENDTESIDFSRDQMPEMEESQIFKNDNIIDDQIQSRLVIVMFNT